ncbi:MAG: DegT/DnrJ/EryC1/StrS family aminotransferase, partial [Promethearchaeia archaeon]
ALGISQLKKVENIIELRRQIGKYYDENLNNVSQIQIIPELEGFRTVYQLYSILLKNIEAREELQNYLLDHGIYTKVYFYPIHLKTFYKEKFGYREGDLPKTEEISKKILTLPFLLRSTNKDQDYIINTLKKFF